MSQVNGHSPSEPGVIGSSDTSDGVRAVGKDGNALSAHGTNNVAIYAKTISATRPAVYADSPNSAALVGTSVKSDGVVGTSDSADGVRGVSKGGVGVSAHSEKTVALYARTGSKGHAALHVQSAGWAALFEGEVRVNGDMQVSGDIRFVNADCAERFDVVDGADARPGTVMVIDESGALRPSSEAYDCRVAGVVSGAEHYRPALVLDDREDSVPRPPIALVGKVYCRADANLAPIAIGDLLTTSSTPGHAMKAADPARRSGAIIGKALAPLDAGIGMVPILIALQ